MSRLKTTLLALVSLNAFGFWAVSCKDDNKGPVCTPGTTRLCAGTGNCQSLNEAQQVTTGTQACLDDGSGYGDCDCSGALRTAPPAMNSTTPTTPYIGRSCTADADCGTGLTCFTATGNDVFGGGAAGGYCTLDCNTDPDCNAIDAQSACVNTGTGPSICLRTCLSQDPTSASENKCLGRVDVVCESPAALGTAMYTGLRMTGWCIPQCNSDDDCPGRRCNLSSGVCTDTAPTGAAIGDRCAANTDCAGGRCLQVGTDDFLCSAPCIFGQPIGCGFGLAPAARDAACFAPLVRGFLSNEGQGDVGICAETCDVDTDCAQHTARGWVCAQTTPANQQLFGRSGFCLPPTPDAGVTDAGDAGSLGSGSSDASAVVDGG